MSMFGLFCRPVASSSRQIIRYASSKASKRAVPSSSSGSASSNTLRPPAKIPRVLENQKLAQVASHASPTTVSASSTPKESTDLVKERLVYEFKGEYHLGTDARFLIGFGLMVFLFCGNAADIVRRPPRQPSNAEEPRVEGWPTWKRYGMAFGLFGAGSLVLWYSCYWPSRILQRITLHAQPGSLLPTREFSRNAQYTTPYHNCDVRLETISHSFMPQLFKAKTIPFDKFRLVGPISTEPKWWHPPSKAFSETAKRHGQLPSNVPLHVAGMWDTYSIRRAGGLIVDPEGLERALLENNPTTKAQK